MGRPKIRVAFVINDILLGGAQATVLALASRIDRDEFLPTVYYLNEYAQERPSLRSAFEAAGVPVTYIGTGGKTSIHMAARRLISVFRNDRPDIIHLHLTDASIAGSLAAMHLRSGRVVIHEHQTHQHYSWKIRVAYRLLRPWARLTICYSPIIEQELFGGVCILTEPPEKISRSSYTIYNGVDVDKAHAVHKTVNRLEKRKELALPEDACVVVSVARLIEWKGQRTLLEAFAKAAQRDTSMHLLLVGEGPLEGTLRERASTIGIGSRVHLVGARTDVYEILAASDIGSLAFTYENGIHGESVGIAGFEIMALGLPLICSDYPGAALSLSNGVDAILVPPGDAVALARKLEELAEHPELRAAIGAAASTRIESTMNWRTIVPLYERIYRLVA